MTDYLLKTLKGNRYKTKRPKNKVACKKTVKVRNGGMGRRECGEQTVVFYKWFGEDLFSSIHLPYHIGHEQLRNNFLANALNR